MSRLHQATALLLFSLVIGPGGAAAEDATASAQRGEAIFARDCTRCHRDPERLARSLGAESAETMAWLDDFLAEHHASDAAKRKALEAYLLRSGQTSDD